ncbi:MAG: TIGR03960 family B12-binding radical SAM protein, partial [Selenomonadaceae bacterium]|nr:TIGR03960 family B12-binding radical SAM protein [Selenomonadaceae bacterium]
MIQLSPKLLNSVTKPPRYTGGEWNSIKKDLTKISCKFALTLPDVYEIGMSNLGLQILYGVLNKREDTAAERVYAPWDDMEAKMREENIPLFTLESKTPVKNFDFWGFSLQYEMIFTNVLNMLDLAGVPLQAADRKEDDPFIVGGGPAVYNVEPMWEFFDFFVIGEGEDVLEEVVDVFTAWKNEGKPNGRREFLKRLLSIEGIYVPSFYEAETDENGNFTGFKILEENAPKIVYKRVARNFDIALTPIRPIVPYMNIVHNRIMLELFRGCTRGCRFCQAGMCYRPVRERSRENLLKLARDLVDATGYDEISLTSLSSADYTELSKLVDDLSEVFCNETVSLSLPSLRIDSFSIDLAAKIQAVRKSSLTFAPEAGTQRLRDVINKGVTEENLISACSAAFKKGWRQVKLYFMMGLPTETDEDILGIAILAKKVVDLYEEIKGKRGVKVTISVACFVPKPHTPFEWFPQISMEEFIRRQQLLKENIRDKSITFNYHDAKVSVLEAALARGDRRLSKVVERAWRLGAKFDGWTDHFKFDIWQTAFEENDLNMETFAKGLPINAPRPFKITNPGVTKEFLVREWEKAYNGELTADCRHGGCAGCGVCNQLKTNVSLDKSANTDKNAENKVKNVNNEEENYYYRAKIRKGKTLAFLSHLDYIAVYERAVIRSKLPVAYSKGFHPHMKIAFSHPLPVGVT